jgi:hypothetical protein
MIYINNGAQELYPIAGFPTDANVSDFYMVQSGQNPGIYDTVYYIDQTNSTGGSIWKFYYDPNGPDNMDDNGFPKFHFSGTFNTTNGGDGLTVVTNPGGGFDLYYTTGNGGQAGNSLVAIHDSAAYDQPPVVTAISILYTAPSLATLKGVAFAPVTPSTAPVATTLPASNITAGSATLNASINPNNGTTAYWFEYGTNLSYGSFTPTNTLAPGGNPVIVSNQISRLLQGTAYHFQIVATNSIATSPGSDSSFSTLTITAPQLGSATLTGGGSTFQFGFSAAPGATFTVWGATNIALPFASWQNLGTATEVSPGNYQFNDPQVPNRPQLFYRVSNP